MRIGAAVAAVVAGLLALPAGAHAEPDDIACVNVVRPDCTLSTVTLQAALDRSPRIVYLGTGGYEGTFGSGARVELVGVEGPTIYGNVALRGQSVAVRNLRITGTLEVGPGEVTLDDLELGRLSVERSDFRGRGLTVNGSVDFNGGKAKLSSSLISGATPFALNGGAQVTTEFCAHAPDERVVAGDLVAPPDDPQPGPGSVLTDAGDPEPLAAREPLEDALGAPRVGGARMRRDIGAYEYHPPGTLTPSDSVLVNGGAEDGLAGWAGTFEVGLYGDPFLPSMRAGRVFAGGGRFFSAAGAVDAELAQRIDVTRAAARIDGGRQTATLSGLLGGYGADADLVDVRATFKDPENRALGSLWLGPVTRDDRARDTTLLPRSVKERIPPRTRAIDVKLLGHRNAGRYTDAYVDNVGLQLSLPGGAVSQPQLGDEPPVKHLKAFVGARLLTARPLVDGRGAGRVKLACPASTVGACSGVIRLRLPGAGGRRVAAFRIARNRVGTTAVRLQAAVGRRVRRERRVPATLSVVSRDGQALERQTVVPVTLVAVRRRARGRGSSGRAALRTRRRAAARSAA